MSHEKLSYCFRIVRLLWKGREGGERRRGRREKERKGGERRRGRREKERKGGEKRRGRREKERKERERGKEGGEHFVMFTTAVPYEKMFRFRNFLL